MRLRLAPGKKKQYSCEQLQNSTDPSLNKKVSGFSFSTVYLNFRLYEFCGTGYKGSGSDIFFTGSDPDPYNINLLN